MYWRATLQPLAASTESVAERVEHSLSKDRVTQTERRKRRSPVTARQAAEEMRRKGFTPLEEYPRNARKAWRSKHACGALTQSSLEAVRDDQGCPDCHGRKVTESDAHERASRNELVPLRAYPMNVREPWLCWHKTCEAEIFPTLAQVTAGRFCDACRRKKISASRSEDPIAATEEFMNRGFVPLVPFPGTQEPWSAIHIACRKTTSPMLSNLRQRPGPGCNHCKGDTIRARLATTELQATLELNESGFVPLEPFVNVRTPWRAIHLPCRAERFPRLAHIREGIGGCQPCGLRAGGQRRRTTEAAALALLHEAGWVPVVPYPGMASLPWQGRHRCGHRGPVTPGVLARASISEGCSGCRNERAGAIRRSRLASAAADEMRSYGYEPVDDYPGVSEWWLVHHATCDLDVSMQLSKIRDGALCRACSTRGQHRTLPARVYVVTNGNAHKVGVASSDRRLNEHARAGWRLHEQLHVPTGARAYAIEQSVLRTLREEHGFLSYYTSKFDMPQGGWTETVDAEEITANGLWYLVTEAAASAHGLEPNADRATRLLG